MKYLTDKLIVWGYFSKNKNLGQCQCVVIQVLTKCFGSLNGDGEALQGDGK